MSNEVELKFEINEKDIADLQCFLNQWSNSDMAESAALSQNKSYAETVELSNTYYDTADYYLRHHGCGLRVRGSKKGNDEKYEITLKRDKKTVSGLHERAEFNANLPNNRLDLSRLPAEALPQNCNVLQLHHDLIPLFNTDFKRQTWLISFANSEIEVALDQGDIISNGKQKIIQEVELEIKQGNKIDLIHFAIELSRFHLHLFSQSKAARGYQLLKNLSAEMLPFNSVSDQNLLSLLQFWQKNEEYALEINDSDFYLKTLNQVATVLSNNPCVPHNEFSIWREQLCVIDTIANFAYSEINTKLKLMLILAIEKNK